MNPSPDAAGAPAGPMTATRADPQQVLEAIRRVVGVDATLHSPEFAGNEREYVLDTIDSGWVSSVGDYVDRFERTLAEIIGAESRGGGRERDGRAPHRAAHRRGSSQATRS